ncbi:hypothetical protein CEXT_403011 [Caerostris extrusa]|uniref:Uncharacterized protein n=1 Tax=Caerostris extrusa TaxID=172846 RepID=A0AAV4S6C8_CAEEX|nr:hypothetical protein CEXT_403011 [Caerostris extrusa]
MADEEMTIPSSFPTFHPRWDMRWASLYVHEDVDRQVMKRGQHFFFLRFSHPTVPRAVQPLRQNCSWNIGGRVAPRTGH